MGKNLNPQTRGILHRRDLSETGRFWIKVKIGDAEECWPWLAATGPGGYGIGRFQGKDRKSHRISYMISFGDIPNGMCVCHKCDNPICVNPSHLWLGTQQENIADMRIKGRDKNPPGGICDKHPRAKLTNDQALAIYHAAGQQAEIAAYYGVKQTTVHEIKRGKKWTEVTGAKYTPGKRLTKTKSGSFAPPAWIQNDL